MSRHVSVFCRYVRDEGWATTLRFARNAATFYGYYTLLAAAIVGPAGKIYAIEPFPDNLRLLCRNIEANGYESVVDVFRGAISHRVGTARLSLGGAANLHTLIRHESMKEAAPFVEVQTTTLDAFLVGKRPIDFLRWTSRGANARCSTA